MSNSSQNLGVVAAAAQLGLQAILVRPARRIAAFVAQVTFEENHEDQLTIVEHPVQLGSPVSDHSFMRPAQVTIRCGWSNSPSSSGLVGSLAAAFTGTLNAVQNISQAALTGSDISQVRQVYADLRTLQQSRIPFEVVTGKRAYKNMLCKTLRVETDKESENSLAVTAVFQEVLFATVTTTTLSAPPGDQWTPATTYPVVQRGVQATELAPLFTTPPAGAIPLR